MFLSNAKDGQKLKIEKITDVSAKHRGMRIGLIEGTVVLCIHKLKKGPVILRVGTQEVAIGNRLAGNIVVSLI